MRWPTPSSTSRALVIYPRADKLAINTGIAKVMLKSWRGRLSMSLRERIGDTIGTAYTKHSFVVWDSVGIDIYAERGRPLRDVEIEILRDISGIYKERV